MTRRNALVELGCPPEEQVTALRPRNRLPQEVWAKQTGVKVIAFRSRAERIFAWLGRWRRPSKDYSESVGSCDIGSGGGASRDSYRDPAEPLRSNRIVGKMPTKAPRRAGCFTGPRLDPSVP